LHVLEREESLFPPIGTRPICVYEQVQDRSKKQSSAQSGSEQQPKRMVIEAPIFLILLMKKSGKYGWKDSKLPSTGQFLSTPLQKNFRATR